MSANLKDYESAVYQYVTVEEYRRMKRRMIEFFRGVVSMGCREGGYPRWGDSVNQLVESAWLLWKWHAIPDPVTGRPMRLHRIAEVLCRNLHETMPVNVSAAVRHSMATRRKPVIAYYALLWRHYRSDISNFLILSPQIKFPKLKSYRGAFDMGGRTLKQMMARYNVNLT